MKKQESKTRRKREEIKKPKGKSDYFFSIELCDTL